MKSMSVSVLPFLLAVIGAAAATDFAKCKSLTEKVLAKNRPEFVLVPNDRDANTFVTSRVEVSISWSHIDALLDKSCVRFYLLEYGPDPDAVRGGRTKRESVSSSATVSPPISKDGGGASYAVHLPDDCAVYYARVIVAFTETEQDADRDDSGMSRSQPRTFWPAAHRVRLDSFSDGIVLSWPPACAHATDGWRLAVCAGGDPERSDEGGGDCHDVSLRGDTPIHLSPLRPCSIYSLDLHSKPRVPTVAKHKGDDWPSLWSFHAVKTLPKPSFDISAGHRDLHLRILQPDCHTDAVVRHWRVTRCDHVPGNDEARRKRALEPAASDSDASEYSSGDGESVGNSNSNVDDDDYYYYYDRDDAASSASARCHHELVSAGNHSLDDGATLSVSLTDLSECTLYAVDMTPTDEAGRALQPGEQYGTIHSTLCGHGEGDQGDQGGGGKSFWFDEEGQGGEEE